MSYLDNDTVVYLTPHYTTHAPYECMSGYHERDTALNNLDFITHTLTFFIASNVCKKAAVGLVD